MTLQDPVFGLLRFDNGWVTQMYVPLLEATLKLTINNSAEFPPAVAEHQVWSNFIHSQEVLKPVMEQIILDYYQRHLEHFRLPYSKDEEEQYVPTLQRPAQVWGLLKPQNLWIETENDETCSLSISFEAKWDEEHGMDLMFYQNQIGISDAGAHWTNRDRYDLQGNLLYAEEY